MLNRTPRRAIASVIVVATAAVLTAHGQTPAPAELPSVALPPELARVLTDYETAWQKKDAAALAALFAEDGFVLSSGVPPIRGRAQIQKHYTGQGGPLALRALAFATENASGSIIGGFSRERGAPDVGKFTLTLRKGRDGRWLIVSDMDNGNARGPAPTPKPMVVTPAGGAPFAPFVPGRPDGPLLAVLLGDPAKGPSATLLKLRKGGGALHRHNADYHAVLLQGRGKHWGEGQQEADVPLLEPGSYWFQPGGQLHGDACLADECLLFVNWAGAIDVELAQGPAGEGSEGR